MLFHPKPPYDFALTTRAARTLFVMGELRDGAYRRALRVGAVLALVEVTSRGTIDQPELEARLLAASGEIDEAALWAKVARVLNLGADLRPFYDTARRDPVLWATVERLYGLHSFQADSLFEALGLTMVEQQIALRMAQAAERWLLAWGGESLDYDGQTYYVFPSAGRIAAATVAELAPLKITFGRMQRLIDVARLDLEPLRDQPFETAYAALIGLKGVGQWTAAWTLIRAQGRYPYVGAADVALRSAVNHYYFGQSGRASVPLVDATFARFQPFEGIAAYYTLMRWAFERY